MPRISRHSLSLSFRVMTFVTIAISLSLWLIFELVTRSIEHHFVIQDAEELEVISNAVFQALEKSLEEGDHSTLKNAVTGHHGVHYQVQDSKGEILFRSSPQPFEHGTMTTPLTILVRNEALLVWDADGVAYRGTVKKRNIHSQEFRVLAAMEMTFHLEFLSAFQVSFTWILFGTGIITLFAAWYGIHQAHGPIRALSNQIKKVHTGRLDLRLDELTVPSELRALVRSFNAMIMELESGFKRLANFSADIAHELRTPLTNIITQSQVGVQKQRSAEEYRDLLYSNLEELERLAKMVNDMLWLAKSENGLIRTHPVTILLEEEFNSLFEYLEPVAEEKSLAFSLKGESCTFSGDRDMLRRAFANLLSNAIRHTPANNTITVHIEQQDKSSIEIRIQNPGEIIPSEHLGRIFDRFYRIDPSRQRHSDGAGLGLSIVKSIIQAHGGTINAESAHGVTTFIITMPFVAAQTEYPS